MTIAAPPRRPRPEKLATGGGEVGILRMGSADLPPLVLVHGFSGDMMTWQFNIGALSRHHHVVAIDLPGHGLSSHRPDLGHWRSMALWLGEMLEALGLDRPHMVGHSLGARLSLCLAENGHDLRSVTMIACAGITPGYDYDFLLRLSRIDSFEEALACSRRLFGEAEIDLDRFARALEQKLSEPEAQASLAHYLEENFAEGKLLPSAPVDWAKLTVPLQFIWGKDDSVIAPAPPGSLPERAAHHVLDRVGHLPHMAAPERINRLILDFAATAG